MLCAHVITAAKCCKETNDDVISTADKIVTRFVKISLSARSIHNHTLANDSVYNYATDLLIMSLVWHGFHDAIREGDGNRILLYWKVLLPIFQQEGHYKYAKEAFLLIVHSQFLSERKDFYQKEK